MITLPYSDKGLIIRTDFSKNSKWEEICAAINNPENMFEPFADFINDPTFENIDIKELPKFDIYQSIHGFVLLVDKMSSAHPEYPVNCIDLDEEFGRTFRVVPSEVWSVAASLALSNMDFNEFADHVDEDGIFRGFKTGD